MQDDASTSAQAVSPFDLEQLRSTPLEDLAVEQAMLKIPVRKPNRNEFFRVNPDPEYVVDSLVIEHVDGMDREYYWVAPPLRNELWEEGKRVRLFTCTNRRDVVFLWPASLPAADGGGRQWATTALMVADIAKAQWVKLRGNRDTGMYEATIAKGTLPEPKWPNHTYRELIELGFGEDRVIDSMEHPVIRELEGRE